MRDIKESGAYCLTRGRFDNWPGSDEHLILPAFKNMVISAIYMIFSIQIIALHKALKKGVNPDSPEGLSVWITLKNT